MRSLILRGGALGDFLVTLPLVRALEERFPDGTVELVGNRTAAALALNAGFLSRVHDQNEARWAALYGDEPLPSAFAGWLGSFDLIACFWPDPDHALRKQLESVSRGKLIMAPAQPTCAPAAQHYLAALSGLTLPPVPLLTALRGRPKAVSGIAIHPGSGSASKNWPRERWNAVSRAFASAAMGPIVTILGPADSGGPLEGSEEAWQDLPLAELADRLATCRLFLGHDSGVSHLAAACGVASVLLFGPTDPAIWAPPSPRVLVLREASALSPERVLDAVRGFLQATG